MAIAPKILRANGASLGGGGGVPLPSFQFPGMPVGFIVQDSTGGNWQLVASSAVVDHTTVEKCAVNPALRWVTYSGGGGGGGVTSAVAGTGIGVSGATGAVTFTNLAPFAADTIISINNSAASPVSAWEGISTLTTNTAGSEVSRYVIKLLSAGAQVTALDIRPAQLLAPNGALATPEYSFTNGANYGMWFDQSNSRLAWSVNGGQSGTANMYLNSTDLILGYALARIFFNPNGDSTVGRNGSGQLAFVGTNGFAFGTGNLGFNSATPVAKQTVTGSKGANAALASVLTALANYGLITDSST